MPPEYFPSLIWGNAFYGWDHGWWGVCLHASAQNMASMEACLTTKITLAAYATSKSSAAASLTTQSQPINRCKDYLKLVTSEHRKDKFLALMASCVCPISEASNLIYRLSSEFDLDTAIGAQLDILGVYIGLPRIMVSPMPGSEIWFTWHDENVGWGMGYWNPTGNASDYLVQMPDARYRDALKAKVAINNWDGSAAKMYEIWQSIYQNSQVIIMDGQDMTIAVAIIGGNLDNISRKLLLDGYLSMRPAGVKIRYYLIAPENTKLFAWGTESQTLSGWNSGVFGEVITP